MAQLTKEDYQKAANLLGCEVAMIRAVAQVESNGNGFLNNGLLVLRFEAHIFRSLTGGRYDKTHPDISHAYVPNDPANKGVTSDYKRLKIAKTLNESAALQACSYGKFQIMGREYWRCGFATVRAFVTNEQKGEAEQLTDFVNFIISKGLKQAMIDKDFDKIAYRYNGANYKINKYPQKMKYWYNLFKGQENE